MLHGGGIRKGRVRITRRVIPARHKKRSNSRGVIQQRIHINDERWVKKNTIKRLQEVGWNNRERRWGEEEGRGQRQ